MLSGEIWNAARYRLKSDRLQRTPDFLTTELPFLLSTIILIAVSTVSDSYIFGIGLISFETLSKPFRSTFARISIVLMGVFDESLSHELAVVGVIVSGSDDAADACSWLDDVDACDRCGCGCMCICAAALFAKLNPGMRLLRKYCWLGEVPRPSTTRHMTRHSEQINMASILDAASDAIVFFRRWLVKTIDCLVLFTCWSLPHFYCWKGF